MPFYRINDKYALRKYTNKIPFVVEYGVSAGIIRVSETEMNVLKRCTGVDEFSISDLSGEEASFLRKMIDENIVQEMNEACPLVAHRAYREYNHKRIAHAKWAITSKCNMNCLHCYNKSGSLSEHESDISLKEAQTIIERLLDYGVESVTLTGGEPTVSPNFMEIVRLVHEAGIRIKAILTNGMLIDEKMLDQFETMEIYPTWIISFDGLGVHEWVRNIKGCEEKVKNNIALCRNRGAITTISINVNKKSLPVLDETIEYFIGVGCKSFRLLRTMESARWLEIQQKLGDNLSISVDDYANFTVDLVNKHLPDIRNGVEFGLINEIVFDRYTIGESLFSKMTAAPSHTSGWCPEAENGVYISFAGHVSPCVTLDSLIQRHGLYCDDINLLKHSLEDIVYGDFYREHFRITMEDVYNASEECQKCSNWDICHGGVCRTNAVLLPKAVAAGQVPEREYLCQRDLLYCTMVKGGYMDAIADILNQI